VLPNIRKSAALFAGSQALPACFDKSSINMKKSTERWWNGTDRGKLKYWEKMPHGLVWD
jgi:hypothetical protein